MARFGQLGANIEFYVEVPSFMRTFTLVVEPTWNVTYGAVEPVHAARVSFTPIEVPVTFPGG